MRFIAPLLLSLAAATAHGAGHDTQTVDEALAAAAREHRPLLLDFQAQWCYSCYFMATHVLTGPQWQNAETRVRVLEVDGDSPDGARWMKKLTVKALPSFVVLKGDGSELGRMVGEQPRETFYATLDRILAGSDALDALKSRAQHGSADAVAEVLASFQARGEIQAGLDWYGTLPAAHHSAVAKDPHVALWHDRLQLEKAAKAQDNAACIATAQKVLAGPIGCDRYYVVENLLDCSDPQPAAARKALLEQQRPALTDLLNHRVFVPAPTCADQRTAVLVAAELEKAVGNSSAETAVLGYAIDFARKTLHGDYASDRNLADNLRVYLNRAGRMDEHDALLPKLMAAYPDDYVYAYRYGRSLLERGKAAEALPYLEEAAEKTFGANRLLVAEQRTKALLALNRRADAEKVVADALQQNGPWFPEQAAKLKAMLKS